MQIKKDRGLLMKYLRIFLLVLTSMVCTGFTCLPRVYTPPIRLWPDETSPKPLAKGENAVSATGGWGAGISIGDDWSCGGGALTYRRGLTNGVEGSVNVSYIRLSTGEYHLNIEPQAFSARAAVKASLPELSRFVSVRAGAGLGTTGAGQYAGLDLGIIVGWHNPYVVPFINGGGYVSFPFNTRAIIFFPADSNSTQVYADNFETTYGVEGGGGVKYYILSKERQAPDKISLGVYAVGKVTLLKALYHDVVEWPVSIGTGMEVEF
jgi:hypothetical protein